MRHLLPLLLAGLGLLATAAPAFAGEPLGAVTIPESPATVIAEPSWMRQARMVLAGIIAAGLVATVVVWHRRRGGRR